MGETSRAQFERDAVEFASRAVKFDLEGNPGPAAYYYREAAQALQSAMLSGSQVACISDKANEYLTRAEELLKLTSSTHLPVTSNAQQLQLDRAKFLLSQALDEDEADNYQEALELYTLAVELCLQARAATDDKTLHEKLTSIASQGLERAESLKAKLASSCGSGSTIIRPAPSAPMLEGARPPPSGSSKASSTSLTTRFSSEASTTSSSLSCPGADGEHARDAGNKLLISGSDGYTRDEIEVLRKTSVINGREYVPFLETDKRDRFAFKLPFCDPDGKLSLSPKQRASFSHWARLEDLSHDPKIIELVDCFSIRQNIDLHALTGWIPERVSLHGSADTPFDAEALFNKLLDRHQRGDVLVTLATGELSEAEAERSGLVPSHAYAMLDVRQVQGRRLFLLKNPWSHLRWKGRFSERDTTSWTPALAQALRYDPHNAAMFDNGVFWIDYDSVCHFFDVAYLNWNPGLFQYTYCTHRQGSLLSWNAGTGPVKDLYNIGENPQFSLELSKSGCAVWILLTRHIIDREDFANNREYICLLVYKNNGKKVYLPFDPPPYLDGVRINSPHYLCKMVVPKGGDTRYTLVVSQYEKNNTIHYTLRAYSSCPFHLAPIGNPYKYVREEKHGMWTAATAGGCGNHPETYSRNPVYQVSLQSSHDNNQMLVSLKGPKQYQIGFDIVTVTVNNPSCSDFFARKGSGMFKSGFTVLELERVPAGVYNVIPSTFKPFQEGPFFLTVSATCPLKMSRIQ
ncbi:hypothetical protein HPB50_016934 [Hyalomma asiaticum]|uniref:Uncharacterized protein n=1 Tax=Hyalomma asiaticum TaxID=266040 RepID=A0ACB7SX73_HYAAI|nr:hypothetical protein HPB50_016934 [Hyalomma asiaticum]